LVGFLIFLSGSGGVGMVFGLLRVEWVSGEWKVYVLYVFCRGIIRCPVRSKGLYKCIRGCRFLGLSHGGFFIYKKIYIVKLAPPPRAWRRGRYTSYTTFYSLWCKDLGGYTIFYKTYI
jgi:hypothetical protein